jgi:hypothetical protein
LALVGLGIYHGINPAMGWLFAVALGLHRQSRKVVLVSLIPIAIGHAAAIAVVALLVVAAGTLVDARLIRLVAGIGLLGWAAYAWRFGSRHRVRVGMRTGLAGLVLWSFLMASAHGAGLMLVPALIPLCLAGTPGAELTATGALGITLAAVAVHTLAMLSVTGAIAVAVYQWLGVAFLRRGWFNLDLLWLFALVATGLFLIASASRWP